ncbi:phospholipase A2 inhibitor NAI [Ictalurus punctatus]|uniref:Phospholipase A2 inhibitor NAI n=1 Tax=Ictalurus punctatus TaxID=7998 RepID=W5UTK4_ICTPU|nr:phospholipase A2 inhibitor NAI [Ictalurus punctatus]
MKSQVTLLLICMLFSKVLSLTCQQCIPKSSEKCTEEQVTCADQCLTATTSLYRGGERVSDVNVKTCGTAETCVTGSMNLGAMKIVNNSKCCKTDLCNAETAPKQAPNGRSCYSCDANSCSETVNCEGSEDHCISASVKEGSNTMSMKGCVSKSLCAVSQSSMSGIEISNMQCCEGNLCNGAENFTLSFLLMIVLQLSSVLFC